MNKQLWKNVVDFDLDRPLSEYGFSIRLAHENKWPVSFTENAILEYKKFMYLAATSGSMVSPSEIVDVVWHQHLLFTQSYETFGKLLGKKIEHIPSTHDRAEAEKFETARKFTKQQYELHFGKQPKQFWQYRNLNDSMKLKQTKVKNWTLMITFIFGFLVLLKPIAWLLHDCFIQTSSDVFVPVFIGICALVFWLLDFFNRKWISRIWDDLDEDNFLFKLTPEELIYMKSEDVEDIVHVTVNRLLREGKITVLPNKKLKNVSDFACKDPMEHAVKEYLDNAERNYHGLLSYLKDKPVFSNVTLWVKQIKHHFATSQLYIRMLIINLAGLLVPLLIGFSRMAIGLMRGKPIFFLALLILALIVMVIYKVTQSISVLTKVVIPKFYETGIEILPYGDRRREWSFYLNGYEVLHAPLRIVIEEANLEKGGWAGWIASFETSTSSRSSCGSGGCGSSCGSSCGGGCGGGCGGCGS